MPALALQLYVFLEYLHFARSSTSPLIYFFIYYTKALPFYGCTSSSLRPFAYMIELGMIFKMIKFIIFINTIVKVFNI